jgi:hypothetical protein
MRILFLIVCGIISFKVGAQDCVGGVVLNPIAEICPGATAIIEAYTSWDSTTYVWSNGETSQSINVDSQGEYGVTATNPAGCLDSASVYVAEIDNGPLVCDTLTLECFETTVAYCWIGSDSIIEPIEITAPGEYEVTVTDANGCTYQGVIVALCDTTVSAVNEVGVVQPVIFPNPIERNTTLSIARGDDVQYRIQIVDSSGRLVCEADDVKAIRAPVQAGLYLVVLKDEFDRNDISKLVVY